MSRVCPKPVGLGCGVGDFHLSDGAGGVNVENKDISAYHNYLIYNRPVILWRGENRLRPGREVAVIMQRTSDNKKTGPLHQITYLDVLADHSGHVGALCGECPLSKACYADVFYMRHHNLTMHEQINDMPIVPRSQWRKYFMQGVGVRFGRYGDSASVPTRITAAMVKLSSFHVGYTHFWRESAELRPFFHASVETLAGVHDAINQGWRVYYTVKCGTNKTDKAIVVRSLRKHLHTAGLTNFTVCPYYLPSPKICSSCQLCAGDKSRLSIIAPAHGSRASSHPGDTVELDGSDK